MTTPQQLTFGELFWVALLIGLIVNEFWRARNHPLQVELFKPTLVLAAILVYYTIFGPLQALAAGLWLERGLFDRRADMVLGWAGAAVFYGSVLFGFYQFSTPRLNRRMIGPMDPDRLHRFGSSICVVGLALFTVVAGVRIFAYINPFATRYLLRGTEGPSIFGGEGANNYLLLSLNFLIPGIILQFTSWVCTRKKMSELLFWLVIALGIFTSLGFRYRIVIVLVPCLLIWYLLRQRRPKLVVLGIAASLLVLMAGFIQLTRIYGYGLSTTALQGSSAGEVFSEGLSDSQVFLTTSAMISSIPKNYPYVGLQPFISVLQFPIPKAWWPQKDTYSYMQDAIASFFTHPTLGNLGEGAFVLCYGEWYLMGGWLALVAMSVLFGWMLRCLWNWFLLRRYEPLAVAIYALTASYLYMVVSRGYMAQIVAGFVFTIAPLFWIYRRWSRPVLPLHAAAPAPPFPRG